MEEITQDLVQRYCSHTEIELIELSLRDAYQINKAAKLQFHFRTYPGLNHIAVRVFKQWMRDIQVPVNMSDADPPVVRNVKCGMHEIALILAINPNDADDSHNRNIRPTAIKHFLKEAHNNTLRDYAGGNIFITTTIKLFNGQHRLIACVMEKRPVSFTIKIGTEALGLLEDQIQHPKSASDQLRLAGFGGNFPEFAASALYLLYVAWNGQDPWTFSHRRKKEMQTDVVRWATEFANGGCAECVDIYPSKFQDEFERIKEFLIAAIPQGTTTWPAAIALFLPRYLRDITSAERLDYVTKFTIDLERGEKPVVANLRKAIHQMRGDRAPYQGILYAMIKAWHAYIGNQDVTVKELLARPEAPEAGEAIKVDSTGSDTSYVFRRILQALPADVEIIGKNIRGPLGSSGVLKEGKVTERGWGTLWLYLEEGEKGTSDLSPRATPMSKPQCLDCDKESIFNEIGDGNIQGRDIFVRYGYKGWQFLMQLVDDGRVVRHPSKTEFWQAQNALYRIARLLGQEGLNASAISTRTGIPMASLDNILPKALEEGNARQRVDGKWQIPQDVLVAYGLV